VPTPHLKPATDLTPAPATQGALATIFEGDETPGPFVDPAAANVRLRHTLPHLPDLRLASLSVSSLKWPVPAEQMAAQMKAALGKVAKAEAGRAAAELAVAAAAARSDEQAACIAQLRQASCHACASTSGPARILAHKHFSLRALCAALLVLRPRGRRCRDAASAHFGKHAPRHSLVDAGELLTPTLNLACALKVKLARRPDALSTDLPPRLPLFFA
jgi:hypothetical protein